MKRSDEDYFKYGNVLLAIKSVILCGLTFISLIGFSMLHSGCARFMPPRITPPSITHAPVVEQLKVKSVTEDSVTIEWQSPGEGAVPKSKACFYDNRAQAYIMRYADIQIADDNWDNRGLKEPLKIPTPKMSGSREEFTIKDLTSNKQYYLGLRYLIKNKCTNTFDNSELAVISFKTNKLIPTPLTLGSLSQDGYQVVPVLVYHDIVEKPKRNTDVSLDNFYKQIKYLHDNGYITITTKQLDDYLNIRAKIPEKSIILSFDDGYKSIYNSVYKILKEFNYHGLLFIYTDAINYKYSSNMTWEQIKEVSKDVFEVQSHTKSHSGDIAFKKQDESQEEYLFRLDKELLLSKAIIEDAIGKKVEFFAYPYGKYSKQLITLLKDRYKYKGAYTVIGAEAGAQENLKSSVSYGYNPFFMNPYKVRRIQILNDTEFDSFKRYLKTFIPLNVVAKDVINGFNRDMDKLNKE
jgi:peptidoglycan/xylan/chitin deacetylase (PgdA/CDA1 family)